MQGVTMLNICQCSLLTNARVILSCHKMIGLNNFYEPSKMISEAQLCTVLNNYRLSSRFNVTRILFLDARSSDEQEAIQAQKTWKKSIMLVWRAAANHKYANVFLHPVTDDEAPGYHSVVFRSVLFCLSQNYMVSSSSFLISSFPSDSSHFIITIMNTFFFMSGAKKQQYNF